MQMYTSNSDFVNQPKISSVRTNIAPFGHAAREIDATPSHITIQIFVRSIILVSVVHQFISTLSCLIVNRHIYVIWKIQTGLVLCFNNLIFNIKLINVELEWMEFYILFYGINKFFFYYTQDHLICLIWIGIVKNCDLMIKLLYELPSWCGHGYVTN